MSKEKKKSIIIAVVAGIIALILIGILVVGKLKEEGIISTKESREIVEQIKNNFNSEERNVIYYASSICSHCMELTPILKEIANEYDMDYYYVDSQDLNKKQIAEVTELLGIEDRTPTTVVVENGKVVDKFIGSTDGSTYVEFLKGVGMIPDDATYKDDYSNITFLDYDTYKEIIADKGTHVIVIGTSTCPHCQAIKPALDKVSGDYDLTINYLVIDKLSNTNYSAFFNSLTDLEFKDETFVKEGKIGTPLVLLVKNGKIKDYFTGERTTSQLIRELKKFGVISE